MKVKLFVLLIIVLSLFGMFFAYLPASSFAQDAGSQQIELSPSTVPTVTPTPAPQQVNYTLPFPGLLPDNPLYFLKAVRDKIIEFLISDPAKKAEFYLLASDKRVNMGYYLIAKGENDMGVLYISKSNNYMSMAYSQAFAAGEKGKGTLQNMKASVKKHQEVVKDVMDRVDKKNRTKLAYELDRLKKMESLLLRKQ